MKATELDEEVLRQMFEAGAPQVRIAEHFGCSQTLISLVIRRLGLVRERLVGGPRGFIFDEDQLCRMFVDGLSLSRIATYFRCSRPTVAKAVGRLCMTREPLFTGNCRHQHPNWRGGRRITSHGYIRVLVGTDCPGADGEGHIFEHRLVMQEALGRPLRDDEVVHHINGIKTDNRLENLTVMTRVEHNEHHKRRRQMARRSREERKNTAMRFAGAL